MGIKLPSHDEELYRRIDEVLHYIWDPIGVSGIPEARDEYYSYLPRLFQLLKSGADAEELASQLTEIVTNRMGMTSDNKRDLEVAQLLLSWQQVINEKHDR